MSIRRLSSLSILTALALAAATPCRAEEAGKTVEAEGAAAIVNGDEAAAKERATKAALRDAVERTIGTMIVADSQTKDFQLVKDQILSTSSGYVSSYDVIDAKKDGESIVVKVRAVVAQGKIDGKMAAAGLTIRLMKYPRMALLIAEQNIGQPTPNTLFTVDERGVENALIDQWSKVGFTFVDMEALSGKLKAANLVSTNPSANEVRQIANLADADVIIVGTAVASLQGNLGEFMGGAGSADNQMKSCKGAISARVFNADSGEILATEQKDKVALHIETLSCGRNALAAAARAFGDELQSKLLEAWNRRQQGGSRIRVTLKGVDSFHLLSEFKKVVSEIRGVQGIDQKTFKDGAADLDLRLDGGDVDAFAGDIDGKSVGSKKVQVTGSSSNTITIVLAK